MAHVILFTDRVPIRPKNFKSSIEYLMYPAGAYKIASCLRDHGFDVLVVPNCLRLSFQGIKEIIKNNKNNLLWAGVSTTFFLPLGITNNGINQYRAIWNSATQPIIDIDCLTNDAVIEDEKVVSMVWGETEIAKIAVHLGKNYSVPLIIGGPNAYFFKSNPILQKYIYTVEGYAETFALELTQTKASNKQALLPFSNSNNEYDNNTFKQSTIHWTDNDLVTADHWLPIEVSRGCAFDCAYCNFPRKSTFDSYKDPEVLRNELIKNYEQYGVTKYMLVDDLYNDSKEKVRILYDKVWSKLPFRPEWTSYMRLDMIWSDPESAEIIKASGARCGSFGVETLHNKAGKKVGKGLGRERILETLSFLKSTWKDDVLVTLLMIAGLPYEPMDSIMDTLGWTIHTDLVHGSSWQPMHIAPPETSWNNRINARPENFDVTWIDFHDVGWMNSENVTRKQVTNLVYNLEPTYPYQHKFSMNSYVDLRSSGFSHQQIANIRYGSINFEDLADVAQQLKAKIQHRLHKILDLST